MAQIMVIEPDELAVTALKKIFSGDQEVTLTFVENLNNGLELLNGSPKNKEIYEKLKAIAESAKNELQSATANELTAKTNYENAAEILEKYETQLEAIGEVTPETQEQKKNLETEIARLREEIKNHKAALQETSKIKSEKEKIFTDKDKAAEDAKAQVPVATKQIYSVLMVSCNLLTPNVNEWVENFKKAVVFDANKDIKIIVLGFDPEEKTVRKYLNPRVSDYMIKPVDELLARQNIKFLALKDNKAKREVYTLQIKETVDLVFEYELEAISEVSFQIRSQEEFQINDFKVFNSELFLRKDQKGVLGKCISSKKSADGMYSSEFWFIGVDNHLSFQIKNVIKNAPKL